MLHRIICVTPFGLDAQNSASDLARQMCAGQARTIDVATRRKGRASGIHLFGAILDPRISLKRKQSGAKIYYQLSDPISIVLVYILHLLTGAKLVVHVLDNFIETAKYRKFMGIPRRLAIFMMRRADQLLTISPAMKAEFLAVYNLPSRTAFRWQPVQGRENCRPGNGRILFGGAINDKTNLAALRDFARILAEKGDGWHLDIYSRGGNSRLEDFPNVTMKPSLGEAPFIRAAADYEAFLVPFNRDAESFSFYRDSCPSKASALFAARIPILIFGPGEFWFLKFLASFGFTTSSLDEVKQRRAVPAPTYAEANEALGALCEVHSLANLTPAPPQSPR